MSKRHRPTMTDYDNPEWTQADFAEAKPARDMLSGLIGQGAADELITKSTQKRGIQKAPTKKSVTLRLDPEVLTWFKAQGKGWQTRINQTLKDHIYHPHS